MAKHIKQESLIQPRCYTIKSSALYIGISPSKLRTIIKRKEISTIPIGGRKVIEKVDLDTYVDSLKCSSTVSQGIGQEATKLAMDALRRLA